MLPGFCFVFLSDLITSVYICRAAPCFPSLFVCLCGHDLVRANQHALPATLGLGVMPSYLRSNLARTRLLACSSWASLRMIFSFSLLNLISTYTLYCWSAPLSRQRHTEVQVHHESTIGCGLWLGMSKWSATMELIIRLSTRLPKSWTDAKGVLNSFNYLLVVCANDDQCTDENDMLVKWQYLSVVFVEHPQTHGQFQTPLIN